MRHLNQLSVAVGICSLILMVNVDLAHADVGLDARAGATAGFLGTCTQVASGGPELGYNFTPAVVYDFTVQLLASQSGCTEMSSSLDVADLPMLLGSHLRFRPFLFGADPDEEVGAAFYTSLNIDTLAVFKGRGGIVPFPGLGTGFEYRAHGVSFLIGLSIDALPGVAYVSATTGLGLSL